MSEEVFSDYIVYADESGDHGLTSINSQFPMFALSLCLFKKSEYMGNVVPAFQELKFRYWGHDSVVMHEADIRKRIGAFNLLMHPVTREAFLEDLNGFVDSASFDLVAAVIDKNRLIGKYASPRNPYEIALFLALERLHSALLSHGQDGRTVHVVFESRGRKEDGELAREFRSIVNNESSWGYRRVDFRSIGYRAVFTKKDANSCGLQVADLTARPLALRALRPEQPNRAFDRIQPKLREMKVFP